MNRHVCSLLLFAWALPSVSSLPACSESRKKLLQQCEPASDPCDEGVCVCCDDDTALCCQGETGVCFDGDLSLTCRAADGCPYDPTRGQACDSTTGRCIRPCTFDALTGHCCNADAQVCRGIRRVTPTDDQGRPQTGADGQPLIELRPDWCRQGEPDCSWVPVCLAQGTSHCMQGCDPDHPSCPVSGPDGQPGQCQYFQTAGIGLCTWSCTYDSQCGEANCGNQPDVAAGQRVCYPYFP